MNVFLATMKYYILAVSVTYIMQFAVDDKKCEK